MKLSEAQKKMLGLLIFSGPTVIVTGRKQMLYAGPYKTTYAITKADLAGLQDAGLIEPSGAYRITPAGRRALGEGGMRYLLECHWCGGSGVNEDECACMDDTCCCLEPEPMPCWVCEGHGTYIVSKLSEDGQDRLIREVEDQPNDH